MVKSKTTFRGGYCFYNLRGTPRAEIVAMEVPKQVVIPLQQGFGEPADCIVKPGDQVQAGQMIGKKDGVLSNPVLATVNGIVKDVKEIEYRYRKIKAVVIESDGTEGIASNAGFNSNVEGMSAQNIGDLLYSSGVTGLGYQGLPTLQKTSPLMPEQVKYVVVSALQTHPFGLPGNILCENKLAEVAGGIRILRKLYPNAAVCIGTSKKECDFTKKLRLATENLPNVYIQALKHKYPQDIPEILTETLTGQSVPDGKFPDAVGAVVIEISALVAVHDAVALGKPAIHKIVSLGGTGYKENLAVRVRIGTTVGDILSRWGKESVEKRLLLGNALVGDIAGDPMTPVGMDIGCLSCIEEDRKRKFMFFLRPGFASDSYSRTFASAYLPTKRHVETNMHGEHRPCIHCSYCENVCPRPLIPHLLSKYSTHDLVDEAIQIRLLGCVECGLCAYVCPSKISLLTDIQKGKELAKTEGA